MSIDLAREGPLAILTLNRPDRLNALTGSMIDSLTIHLHDLSQDGSVRCVVLTGAGRGFCAGHDLSGSDGEAWRTLSEDEAAEKLIAQSEPVLLIREMPKPVIAAIRGPAAGSGLVLAMACDLRVASDNAQFKLAFASSGRCGDPGASYLLSNLVGAGRARQMFLTDPLLDATAALDAGLVHEAVADDTFDQTWRALATRLAEGPTAAFGEMKRNLAHAQRATLAETITREAPVNARISASHDAKEAALAFMAKRNPVFAGR